MIVEMVKNIKQKKIKVRLGSDSDFEFLKSEKGVNQSALAGWTCREYSIVSLRYFRSL